MLCFPQVLVIVGYSLLFNIAIVSNVLALMMEVNSALLHGRKLLQMFGMPFSHWFYRIVVVLNLISFLFFRGVPLSLLWIGFYHNFYRCTTAHAFALGIVLVFMAFLNPVLFWRLLKNDLLRGSPKKKEGPVSENGRREPHILGQNGQVKDEVVVRKDGKESSSPRNGFNVLNRSTAS